MTNLRDIIADRMRRPFTRQGLAQTILQAEPTMAPDAAKRLADAAVDMAVRAGTVSFRREGGMAIFRPTEGAA